MGSFDGEKRREELSRAFAVLLSFSVLITLQGVGTYLVRSLTDRQEPELIPYLVGTLGAAVSMVKASPVSTHGSERGTASCVTTAVLAACLMLVANFLYGHLLGAGAASCRDVSSVLHSAASGVFLKPAIEELLFRGLYLSALSFAFASLKHGESLSVAVTSVLFALWHTGAPILAFFCGCVLGALALFLKKRNIKHSILFPITAHGIYNAVLYGIELWLIQ